jgi:hypothetical protein
MVVARVSWLRVRLRRWLVAGVGGMSGEAVLLLVESEDGDEGWEGSEVGLLKPLRSPSLVFIVSSWCELVFFFFCFRASGCVFCGGGGLRAKRCGD